MPAKASPIQTIDDYIQQQPIKVARILRKIRAIIRQAAPEAHEVISYRMPAFRGNRMLLYFAAFKNHIGIFPPIRGDPALMKALKPYAGPKGNLRFPLDKPMPYPLIKRIAKLRAAQDAQAVRTPRKSPSRKPRS